MSPRVKLSDIIQSISHQTSNTSYYLDKKKGKIVIVSKELLRSAEEDSMLEGYPEWQNELIKLAHEILSDENEEKYIAIPGKFVIHEYSTMENFCLSLDDEKISKPLCQAIMGGGAFNRFKSCIRRYGIVDEWRQYRYQALKKIVIDWCEENDIEYEDQ